MSVQVLASDPSFLTEPADPGPLERESVPPQASFRSILGAPALAATAVAGGPLSMLAAGLSAAGSTANLGSNEGLGGIQRLESQGEVMNLQYLAVQQRIEEEDRAFSTLSNVLHARHETAKAAIDNIRS